MVETLTAGPRVGERLPNLTLTSTEGQQVQIEAYRHRSNLVVAFLFDTRGDANNRLLDALIERREDFSFEEANVLVVVQAGSQAATQLQRGQKLPFPLLVTEEEVSVLIQAGTDPVEAAAVLYVLDRYGQIFAIKSLSAEATSAAVGAVVDDLVAWLQFVNLQCPECGVPEWPAP